MMGDRQRLRDAARRHAGTMRAASGGFGDRSVPQRDLSYTQIVRVTNKGTAEADDWPIWSPIIVNVPDGGVPTDGLGNAAEIEYAGYRPDSANANYSSVLGITQEPIVHGESGRVCIRGVTLALSQRCPSAFTETAAREWVHVRKVGDRWTLRTGPAGDARLLQYVGSDYFQDGVYNDQALVSIDLCQVTNRVPVYNGSGAALPMHSCVARACGHYNVQKVVAGACPWNRANNWELVATCGFDLPVSQYGWGYLVNPQVPVCMAVHPSFAAVRHFGPAPGEVVAWPHLTGFQSLCRDWYLYGDNPQCHWVIQELRPFWAKAAGSLATGGSAYACSANGTAVFDGGVYTGITFPTITMATACPQRSPGTGFVAARQPNIQAGQIFRTSWDVENQQFLIDPGYLDDPIGTVKLWAGTAATIPSGWVQLSGTFLPRGAPTAGGTGAMTYGSGSSSVATKDFILIQRTS